jgi:uncharacterized membrane-anchored protein YjiN (DUF445 family)
MRRLATGLLLAMCALFVAARLMEHRMPWLAFAAAFAEAAMVGALADWFAVTALFRHPLGLPIPHTAIIPRNKDRIGANIAQFLEHNFITHEVLRGELAQVDFAGGAARWLAKEENSKAVAERLAGAVPALLKMVEDRDAGEFVRKAMSSALQDVRLAPMLGQILSVLVAGRQHVRLLQRVLAMVAHTLEENRDYLRQKVHEYSPKWMPRMIDDKFFERLMDGLQSILDDLGDEDSEWRARFQAALEDLIEQLAHSPEYEEKLRGLLARGLAHPVFREYVSDVWQDIRERLQADADLPESRVTGYLQRGLAAFARTLAENGTIRERLNGWLREFTADAVVERRGLIVAVVQRVIDKWDAETISRKLELQVGSDLQFIRINGTLVGGVVGLLLYCASLLLSR